MRSRHFHATCVTLLLFFAAANVVRGQHHWVMLASPVDPVNGSGRVVTPYFLNAEVGFIFNCALERDVLAPYFVSGQLDRTTDGGLTWSSIAFFDSIGSITELCFVSLQHGYASTATISPNPGKPSGIYETTDQGLHWQKISAGNLSFGSVYATNDCVFATTVMNLVQGSYFVGNQILYSRNDGVTWDSIANASDLPFRQFSQYAAAQSGFQWIYGNRDSLVVTTYTDSVGDFHLVYSTNMGTTWNSNLLEHSPKVRMIALFISPHSCQIIRQKLYKLDFDSDTYTFLKSIPPYSEWDTSLLHIETGDWLTGNPCAMYLDYAGQDLLLGPLQRSTDNGSSWNSDGNEHTDGATPNMNEDDDAGWPNISAVGYGAVVYTEGIFDKRLWKTTDGGDGTLSVAALAPRIEFAHGDFPTGNDTLVMTPCSPSSMIIYYQNLACAITKLYSISISGLSSNEYSLTSTNHNDCLSLPDSTYVTLAPTTPGIYPIAVKAHFIDDEYNTIDTMLNVVLTVNPGGTTIPLNVHFKASTITTHAGDTIEIPVYLSGNVSLGASSITLPFSLDTDVLRPIGFQPAISGLMGDSLSYANGTETVQLQDSELTLDGDTIIGYLRCLVYLSDTLATSIALQNVSLNSAAAPCTALSLSSDSVNILITGCGDKTLLHFLKTGRIPFAIEGITPNPASIGIDVQFQNDLSESISYELMDALGNTWQSAVTRQSNVSLDAAMLPPGIYFFSASIGDGIRVTRKVIVEH